MARTIRRLAPLALLVVLAGSCTVLFHSRSETAHAWVKDGALLVDVRSPDEFASGHLEGAKNIPVGEIEARSGELGPKDAKYVVYCHSGFRASRAVGILEKQGFTHLFSLGPMGAW